MARKAEAVTILFQRIRRIQERMAETQTSIVELEAIYDHLVRTKNELEEEIKILLGEPHARSSD